jgi:hypothetical protein
VPEVVAPKAAEDLPELQRVHGADPGEILYVPAAHAVHVPPFVPVYPTLQRQLVWRALPLGELEDVGQLEHELSAEAPGVVEYLPATQAAHAADPAVILYVPATHAVHVPPFVPVCPRLQRQLALRALPLGEFENVGQMTHELSAEAPGVVEYLPAPQLKHVLSAEAP